MNPIHRHQYFFMVLWILNLRYVGGNALKFEMISVKQKDCYPYNPSIKKYLLKVLPVPHLHGYVIIQQPLFF